MDRKSSSGKDVIEPLYCSYENYNDVSKYYDIYRKPVAMDMIIDQIKAHAQANSKKVEDLVIADFGCGTGNYIRALMDALNFNKYIGIEYCDGMIGRAKEKFANDPRVQLIKASILEPPLESNSVDIIVINQVLHHLDATTAMDEVGNHDYPNMRKTLSEALRILVPKGRIMINFIEPLQLKGFWQINHLMLSGAVQKMMERFASHEFYLREMKNIGFGQIKMEKVSEYLMDEKYYINTHLVLDPNYRKANSFWALLSEDETKEALKLFNRIINFFGQENFQDIIKKEAEFYGQSTELFAVKEE